MQRAQTEGDVTDGLVMTGQVASAMKDIIDVAEFVPRMVSEAANILQSLASQVRVTAAVCNGDGSTVSSREDPESASGAASFRVAATARFRRELRCG